MRKTLESLFSSFGVFFLALNGIGGLAGGMWLIYTSAWRPLFGGVLILAFSDLLIGLGLLPSFALRAAGRSFARRGSVWGLVFTWVLSNTYLALVTTSWCLLVLFLFVSGAHSTFSFLTTALWSFGVALGPWQFLQTRMARRGKRVRSSVLTAFAQLAFVSVILTGLFAGVSFPLFARVFLVVMTVAIPIQMEFAYVDLDRRMSEARREMRGPREAMDPSRILVV
ncbi:hypothetical protein ACFL3S_08150 [Gemmatimonadota bacterium]